MNPQILFATMLAIQVGLPANAAEVRPDLNGTWNTPESKHTFTERRVSVATMRLDLQGPVLQETLATFTPPGGQKISLKYLTDGTETMNEFAGQKIICRAWWQKTQLVIEWKWQESGKGVRRFLSMPEAGSESIQMLIQDFQPARIDQKTIALDKL